MWKRKAHRHHHRKGEGAGPYSQTFERLYPCIGRDCRSKCIILGPKCSLFLFSWGCTGVYCDKSLAIPHLADRTKKTHGHRLPSLVSPSPLEIPWRRPGGHQGSQIRGFLFLEEKCSWQSTVGWKFTGLTLFCRWLCLWKKVKWSTCSDKTTYSKN